MEETILDKVREWLEGKDVIIRNNNGEIIIEGEIHHIDDGDEDNMFYIVTEDGESNLVDPFDDLISFKSL